MSYAVTSKAVKSRLTGSDDFATPPGLAASLLVHVPLQPGQTVLDPFRGPGAFFDSLPGGVVKRWCEIKEGHDFFWDWQPADWLVSNPPYSVLDAVLRHSADLAKVGFAYLLQVHALTPKRLQELEERGFGLVHVHLCKVQDWYGMTAFCVWRRGEPSLFSWDRKVWLPVGYVDPRSNLEAAA
jgi:hypothetical protein